MYYIDNILTFYIIFINVEYRQVLIEKCSVYTKESYQDNQLQNEKHLKTNSVINSPEASL